MKAFHAYDIRGIFNEDFNLNDVFKIGYFLPKLMNTSKILVGRDVRESSDDIFNALCSGITKAGAQVFDVGLSTTPMIYWLTAKYEFEASVMITASHNPKQYNGMKISGAQAKPIGYDTGLGTLEQMIQVEMPTESIELSLVPFNKKSEYIQFLKTYLPKNIETLNLSIDCSNGMGALLIKDLLGNQPHYIFDDLDGTFPNHEANPLAPENIVDLQKAVHKNQSDLGIIFDGDADRVMFVDEKGHFISPDLMIAVLGHYFMKKTTEKQHVLHDIRSSKAVGEYLSKLGNFQTHTWKVGRAFAAPKMKELDATFGGELAGHYYLKDFYYSDSAMLAMLMILEVMIEMKEDGITVSQLISQIKGYANSGEINFKIENKEEAIEAVLNEITKSETPIKTLDFDGFRLEFESWWFNIRPSNTEPYLRLIVEASDEALLAQKTEKIKGVLKLFL